MWAAFSVAALLIVDTATQANTPLLVRIVAGGAFAIAYALAWFIPIWFRHRHLRDQNQLLERCRALLLVGARALEAGEQGSANRALETIRRLEAHWRLGNTMLFKVSLAAWAGLWACVVVFVLPLGAICLAHYGSTGQLIDPANLLLELWVATAISMTAPMYGLVGYFEPWVNPWVLEDCGERLSAILHGKRLSEPFSEGSASNVDLDGLTPGEVLGLGVMFTRKELDLARRKLVKQFHPIKWYDAGLKVRAAREMARKRVDAAYEALREEAS
jgi:hypothetical protein